MTPSSTQRHDQGPKSVTPAGCYLWVPITNSANDQKDKAHLVVFACMQMIDVVNDPKWEGILKDPAWCPSTPSK
jgi:hypothetical protein